MIGLRARENWDLSEAFCALSDSWARVRLNNERCMDGLFLPAYSKAPSMVISFWAESDENKNKLIARRKYLLQFRVFMFIYKFNLNNYKG